MESYLIVKLGALGDVVMCTALLKEIQIQNPTAKVSWIIGKKTLPLLEILSAQGIKIDNIIPVDEAGLYHSTFFSKCKIVLSIWRQLLGKKYTQCFIPYRNWKYLILTAVIICKKRVSFYSNKKKIIPGRFHPDLYRALLSDDFDTPNAPASILNVHIKTKDDTVPEVLLLPGGACNAKSVDEKRRWPVEHYRELAEDLFKRGYRVGLIGDKNDEWVLEKFKNMPVTSYIGKSSLERLLTILSSTKVLVTHDSGPMHLMRLVQGKIVALFGPTLRNEKILIDDNCIAITTHDKLSCSPCYDGTRYAQCSNPVCMKMISPSSVLNVLIPILEKKDVPL